MIDAASETGEVRSSSDETVWRARDSRCPVCRGERRKVVGPRGGDAHRDGRGLRTNVVRCRDCDCFYTNPTLVPEFNPYARIAAANYFRIHDPDRKRGQGRELADFAQSVLGRAGSLLELGCGRGELLEGARERGWEVCGIEMTPEFCAIAERRGITVERASAETARFLERQYDVILFAAILEHLYRPLDVLVRARRALRPGGLVFIDVPNERSLIMRLGNLYMRLRGRSWAVNLSPTFPPFHVVGFTPKTLRRALASAGFRVLVLDKPRWCNALPRPRSLAEVIEHRGLSAASWFGSKIGMGDGISCWAAAV